MLVAPFSGGHLNPAVSFGFLVKNGIIDNTITGVKDWHFFDFLGRCVA